MWSNLVANIHYEYGNITVYILFINSKLHHDISHIMQDFNGKETGNVKNILEDRNKVINT